MVCKAWNELYRSQNASPLHEALVVDFRKELERALRERLARGGLGLRRPVVHASRVISWSEGRAEWVRKLHIGGKYSGALEDFSSEDLSALVAVAGSSLTELWIGPDLEKHETSSFELCQKRFWNSLRDSVIPHRRLRSLVVHGAGASVSDVAPLAQLAGSLEELVLYTYRRVDVSRELQRFPESFSDLTELQSLRLIGY